MNIIRNCSASALLLAAHAGALGQSNSEPVQQVVVGASASDQRAQSTTTAIVIGRDELLRHGDANLLEVLKRQPGITIDASAGREPAIRMRGMGAAYVSILLNGSPAPAGFSLESLSPELIERVEIRRVATAETSGQAVAGAINVILRRAGPASVTNVDEIKAGSAFVAGYAAPQLLLEHSGRAGALTYTLAATVRRTEHLVTTLTTEQGERPALLRHTASNEHQVDDVLELAPRLSWQPTARDTITSQTYLRQRHVDNARGDHERTEIGSPSAFPRAELTYETRPLLAYSDLAWARKLDAGARLAAKLSVNYTTRDAVFMYRALDPHDNLLATHRVASGPIERESTFNGSLRRPLWGSHALAAGWDLGRKQRREYRRELQTDANGAALLTSDEHYRAEVSRAALFIQDEWDIDPAWSAYLGLRRENLHTVGEGNAHAPVDVGAGAWSPIFQTLFSPTRADDDSGPRDQFRLAIGRTYKAPNIVDLMPRRYTVDNNNSATNPDQQGNPNLRPELALGIDLAWERTIGKGGMVGVSAFHKRIRDITLVRVFDRDGIWTATPENQGDATVRGIEFEGKLTRGSLSARVNLARNWSHVERVPGPDNRIEGQPAYSGNVGLDFASPSSQFDLGGAITFRGPAANRSSAQIYRVDSPKRQLDLTAVWKPDAKARLRLSVADVLHQDYDELLAYEGDSRLARTTNYRTRTSWRVIWEQSL
jgi:outer membrane receptor protein involved in Fe transport